MPERLPAAPGRVSAELVTIGDELLLGSTVDTNASHIARALRDAGVDLLRKTTVGDSLEAIADAVRAATTRADLVLTTGGLGPTADDPTRDAIALAMGLRTEYRPELWEQVRTAFARYGSEPGENNRQQAFVPAGAVAIANPVGTAPAFRVATARGALVALPGVPREMQQLLATEVLPWIRSHFGLTGVVRVRVLHTAGVGESVLDARVRDLEALDNPDLGLAAHAGQVDLRITVRAASGSEADALLAPIEADLRSRLGDWVFGTDDETLAGATLARLAARGWRLASLESGTRGKLATALTGAPESEAGLTSCLLRPDRLSRSQLVEALAELRRASGAEAALGVSVVDLAEGRTAHLAWLGPDGEDARSIAHGGHPDLAAERAVNHALELVRRRLAG